MVFFRRVPERIRRRTDGCFQRQDGHMRIKTSHSYQYREVAGQYYLIPVGEAADRSKIPLQLTETAAWIWTHLEAGASTEETASEMTKEYEVGPDDALSAVERYAALLLEKGMAEIIKD